MLLTGDGCKVRALLHSHMNVSMLVEFMYHVMHTPPHVVYNPLAYIVWHVYPCLLVISAERAWQCL